MGLRRVAGQWVPGDAAGKGDVNEDYYMSLLNDDSEDGNGGLGMLLKQTPQRRQAPSP